MANEFTMPKLGLTMTDGTITEWLVPDGAMVQAGDPVLVIETDKVETEVEARESGILSISGVVGENYLCGEVIAMLLSEGEAPVTTSPAEVESPPPAATAEPVPEPAASTGAEDSAAAGPPVTVVGADVAVRGEGGRILASPRARACARELGVGLAAVAGSGPGGRILFDDVVAFHQAAAAGPPVTAVGADVAVRGEGGRILASPRARACARELGVGLAAVAGSGPGGRILFDDVVAFHQASAVPVVEVTEPAASAPVVESAPATPITSARAAGVAATAGARMLADLLGIDLRSVPIAPGARLTREDVASWVRLQLAQTSDTAPPAEAPDVSELPLLQEPSRVIPLRGMRGVIAERMASSLREMAQLTLSVDADMSAINAERERTKQAGGVAPGYTAWVIAAAARALTDHPYVNSQVTADGVAWLPEVHLGVAVALDNGLIVPVIRNADGRAVADLHSIVADLAGRARDSKLKLNELEGGTFSVTALGMYGVDMFTPVINPPNSAILGVGRLRTETRWTDGHPAPVTVMTLSLTWDHRAFDGAPAAEFAQSIVGYLEDPSQLLE